MARLVVQRVQWARVEVDHIVVGSIGPGLLILIGIERDDAEIAVERLADKIALVRIFSDDEGRMNRSASDVNGSILVVSQFTLLGDIRKGRRPSFSRAADPQPARLLCDHFVRRLEFHGYRVEVGQFGEHMAVMLENDGPVTLVVDSRDL